VHLFQAFKICGLTIIHHFRRPLITYWSLKSRQAG
jgi:hypothetical protein